MASYFIADLHLAENRPDITDCFLQFLTKDAIHADALYILGDLFEIWIGDDNHTQLSRTIANALHKLSKLDTKIFFIHGNRDFLIGKQFAKKSGMVLLPEVCTIDLYGKNVLIMHGDTLCTDDIKYQNFRKTSRSWWWKSFMLLMPLSFRRNKAKQIQQISAEQKSDKTLEIMDVNQHEVIKMMKSHHVNLLIHGHTHRPAVHDIYHENAHLKRIVLGDWYEQGAWLKVDENNYEMLNHPLSSFSTT